MQFVSITGKVSQPFYFFQTIKHECAQTWQVWRSEFDAMLLDNARSKGVEVRQHISVRDVLMEGTRVVGVRADAKDGPKGQEIRAKVVVDASGRDSLLSRKFGWKDRDADLNKIAVWSYFKGAKRDPGLDEGATTVAYVPQKGWFWYIPLHSNIVSVGVVGEPGYLYRDTRDPEAIFQRGSRRRASGFAITQRRAARSSRCASRASTRTTRSASAATASAWSATRSRFSTRSSRLASFSRSRAARWRPTPFMRASGPDDVTAAHFDAYYERQRHAVMSFRRLVYAFYDLTFSFREFLQAYPHLQSLIVDTLVGNVFTDLTPLFTALEEYNGRQARTEIDVTTA